MGENERVDEYLARAARAEEFANKATVPFDKQSWLAIAQGYRELADLRATGSHLKRPSPSPTSQALSKK
jgi:hypothetical protein